MHYSWWQVLVLAVVQGITEFLPISSDGHLAIVRPLLFADGKAPESLDLTIVLHLGTLGSILVYYRTRIARLLGEDRRVVPLLILGTLPAVALVLVSKVLLDDQFEQVLESPLLAGFMLPVTGGILLWSLRCGGEREYRDLTWIDSLLIGTCQATAILPGLSRSGTTIASGLGLGLNRPAAATYSFLLAIPALAGAGCYEALKQFREGGELSTPPVLLALGAALSFAVGLGAIALLERLLLRGQLKWFGWYCIALGIAVIAWQLTREGEAPAEPRLSSSFALPSLINPHPQSLWLQPHAMLDQGRSPQPIADVLRLRRQDIRRHIAEHTPAQANIAERDRLSGNRAIRRRLNRFASCRRHSQASRFGGRGREHHRLIAGLAPGKRDGGSLIDERRQPRLATLLEDRRPPRRGNRLEFREPLEIGLIAALRPQPLAIALFQSRRDLGICRELTVV